jgi:hypothetical protein
MRTFLSSLPSFFFPSFMPLLNTISSSYIPFSIVSHSGRVLKPIEEEEKGRRY